MDAIAMWLVKAQAVGVALLIAGWIWWKAFEEGLNFFKIKKLFIQFLWQEAARKEGPRKGTDA